MTGQIGNVSFRIMIKPISPRKVQANIRNTGQIIRRRKLRIQNISGDSLVSIIADIWINVSRNNMNIHVIESSNNMFADIPVSTCNKNRFHDYNPFLSLQLQIITFLAECINTIHGFCNRLRPKARQYFEIFALTNVLTQI